MRLSGFARVVQRTRSMVPEQDRETRQKIAARLDRVESSTPGGSIRPSSGGGSILPSSGGSVLPGIAEPEPQLPAISLSDLGIDGSLLLRLGAIGRPVDFSKLARTPLLTQLRGTRSDIDLRPLAGALATGARRETVQAALGSLRAELGVGAGADGALLALAIGQLKKRDEPVKQQLATQEATIRDINVHLNRLLATEGRLRAGDDTLAKGQVRGNIETTRSILDTAMAARASLRRASASEVWARDASLLSALAPGVQPYGNPLSGFVHQAQAQNACGPTTLSMILHYYGKDVPPDQLKDESVTYSELLLGTTSAEVVEMAEKHGLVANRVNHGSAEQLKACIDNGIPPMVMGAWESGEMHYLAVTGYRTDEQGGLSWTVMDPAQPAATNPREMTSAELDRFWSLESRPNFLVYPGVENLFIAMAPAGSPQAAHLPPEDLGSAAAEIDSLENLMEVAYGLKDLVYPFDENGDFVGVGQWLRDGVAKGVFEIGGGVAKLAASLPAWALAELGQRVPGDVGKVISRCSDVLGTLSAGIGDTVDVITDTVSDVIDELCDGNIGSAIEDVIEAPFEVVESIVDTFTDVISSILGRSKEKTRLAPREILAAYEAGWTQSTAGLLQVKDGKLYDPYAKTTWDLSNEDFMNAIRSQYLLSRNFNYGHLKSVSISREERAPGLRMMPDQMTGMTRADIEARLEAHYRPYQEAYDKMKALNSGH